MSRAGVTAVAVGVLIATVASAEEAPDFVGQLIGIVAGEIEAADFDLVVERVDSPEAVGSILMQAPEPGQSVGPGRVLWLRVSDGVVMPDVRMRAVGDATLLLSELGASALVQVVSEEIDVTADTAVVDQFPEPGARFDAHLEAATLMVGWLLPEPLPDLAGVNIRDATARLEALGLSASPMTDEEAPKGTPCKTPIVIHVTKGTDPPSGTRIVTLKTVSVLYRHEVVDYHEVPCAQDGSGPL